MKKKIIIWVVVVIVFSNLPGINKEILRIVDSERFCYSNADATYTTKQDFGFKSSGHFTKELGENRIKEILNKSDENVEIF